MPVYFGWRKVECVLFDGFNRYNRKGLRGRRYCISTCSRRGLVDFAVAGGLFFRLHFVYDGLNARLGLGQLFGRHIFNIDALLFEARFYFILVQSFRLDDRTGLLFNDLLVLGADAPVCKEEEN